MLRRHRAIVLAALLAACAQPRSQDGANSTAATAASVASVASAGAGAATDVPSSSSNGADPSPTAATNSPNAAMQERFVFRGPPADSATARARVARAFVHQAADPKPNPSLPTFTTLDDALKDHSIAVTPNGAVLQLIMSPAFPRPAWEFDCEIDASDQMTGMVVATIAYPPPPPSRP